MSEKYKFWDPTGFHYVTETVVGWIDVFTRVNYSLIVIDSLEHCIKKKGLNVHAFVIMPSHLHMIISAEVGGNLSDIMRDFKKHTSTNIVDQIKTGIESRKEWMLPLFAKAAEGKKRIKNYKFWQDGNHPIALSSPKFFEQKLNYIHQNPVKARIVNEAKDYVFSSASNYAGLGGVMEVKLLETGFYDLLK